MAFIPGTLIFDCEKTIGMGFYDAVIAAGLANARYSVMTPGENGSPAWIVFTEETTQADMDAIIAIYEAYDPAAEQLAILATSVRAERDKLLRNVYDAGINMALRAARMSTTPEELSYAEGKIVELDNYAQALEGIPEQPGFPSVVTWPATPVK